MSEGKTLKKLSVKSIFVRLVDSLLFRYNFLVGSADPENFLSPDIIQILENTGYHVKSGVNRNKILFLVFNKRIFRPDLSQKKPKLFIPNWEKFGLKKKKELIEKAVRKCHFYVDKSADAWNMAVYRDKESKKISFFDFKKGLKKVVWVDHEHYSREVNATSHFAEHGVHVLGHESYNDGDNSLIQKLIGTPGDHYKNFHPIDEEILNYALKTGSMKPIKLAQTQNLPVEIIELAAIAAQLIKKNFWIHNNEAAYTLVHGDLNPENILHHNDKTWLIDFDRTFEATVYYDFIYLWINNHNQDLEKLKDRINKLNNKFYGENVVPDSIGLNLALAFFVYDNIRFIVDRCEIIRDARFTIFLLNNVKTIWPRYQEILAK